MPAATYELFSEITDKTLKDLSAFLSNNKGKDAEIVINSPGGSVSAGLAISNLIREHGNVVAKVIGCAASIASVIAVSCKRVIAAENALLFVHKPLIAGEIEANAESLRRIADGLDVNEQSILNAYLQKSGGKTHVEYLKELLSAETYLNAKQAMKLGLVDEVSGRSKADVVNLHRAMLNISMEESQTPPADTPAPETKAPEWQTAIDELKAVIAELQTRVATLEAAEQEQEQPAPAVENKEKVEVKNESKVQIKAIRPPVSDDAAKSEMSAIDRAKEYRKKLNK